MTPPGTNLAHSRKAKGLSQEALAKLLGTTQGTVKSWETRGNIPSPWLCKIADLLGTTTDALLGRSDPTPQDLDRRTLEARIYEEAARLSPEGKQAILTTIRAMLHQ